MPADAWEGRRFMVDETVHEDEPDGDAVLGPLVARVLGVMVEQGVPLVELEGHLTDAHIDVLTGIPAVGADPMTVFVTA